MHPVPAQRFNAELLPRIVERVHRVIHGNLQADILAPEQAGQTARLRVWATASPNGGRYPHPLNIVLSWDSIEVDRLFATGGDERFAAYLDALPAKLDAWQQPRQIDLASRTQADAVVFIGGLDFEHLLQ